MYAEPISEDTAGIQVHAGHAGIGAAHNAATGARVQYQGAHDVAEIASRRAAKRMKPTFITIHSTANHSMSATALQHSRALTNGSITNRSWHFTADQYMVVQNLPLNETGWHAGSAAGNNNSIGIEMCEAESLGQNHYRTWNRAAKLTAVLMKRYRINMRHVVPHYHWTRKNCPAPLMTNGRPGPKWSWFLSRIDYYYRCINNGRSNR